MKTQLYDVRFFLKGKKELDRFMMRAPLHIVSSVLDLHKDAERRIVSETDEGKVSALHHSRGIWSNTVHLVTKAHDPLVSEIEEG